MKKEEAVERLKKNGYTAVIEEGLPTVIVSFDEYAQRDKVVRKIKKLLNQIEYDGSWSIRPRREKDEDTNGCRL